MGRWQGMSDERMRSLMRKIALGLPVVLPVITAPFTMGIGCYPLGYECPRHVETAVVEYTPAIDANARIDCAAACGANANCEFAEPGRVSCTRTIVDCPPAGRRPAGELIALEAAPTDDPVVRWLRDATILEAASVAAFDALARELEAHGAPPALARGARRAMRDELAHTRSMASLAALYGGPLRLRVDVGPSEPRPLAELAAHNAIEGCQREAWGAVEAASRARYAADPRVRAAFASIARDEARHALLAFAIDDWIRSA